MTVMPSNAFFSATSLWQKKTSVKRYHYVIPVEIQTRKWLSRGQSYDRELQPQHCKTYKAMSSLPCPF
jgi:hypothetical protein